MIEREIDLLRNKLRILCIWWFLFEVLAKKNYESLSIILNVFKNFTKSYKILKIYNAISNLINLLKFKLQNTNHKNLLKKIFKIITFL